MNKSQRCIALFGDPVHNRVAFERNHMVLYDIPDELNNAIPVLPNRIYMNKIMVDPFTKVLRELVAKKLDDEIKTFDGCFVVRKSRGLNTLSMHSFGIAIDMNAAWNPLIRNITPSIRAEVRSRVVKWSDDFLNVWRSNGFECGADWIKTLDGMHFELSLPS